MLMDADSQGNDNAETPSKIAKKLHYGLRGVKKGAKKVKTFETQKLVKRLKALRLGKIHGSESIHDIVEQLEIMKRIGHKYIGTTSLARKIRKDGVLSGNDSLHTALREELTSSVSHAHTSGTSMLEEKVLHRLLSSRILARLVDDVVDDLRRAVLGINWIPKPKDDGNDVERSAKRARVVMDEDDSNETSLEDMHAGKEEDQRRAEGEDGRESDTNKGMEDQNSDNWGMESDSTEDRTSSHGLTANAVSTLSSNGVKSTFLPSLAVGFTRGNSADSDWSDNEAAIAEGGRKKNRRGQRARRVIWEKRYGQNANHKKRERENAEEVAIAKERKGQITRQIPGRPQKRGRDGRMQIRPMAQMIKGGESLVEEGNRLHPSWAAKKRLKERELAAVGQGTKIRF